MQRGEKDESVTEKNEHQDIARLTDQCSCAMILPDYTSTSSAFHTVA